MSAAAFQLIATEVARLRSSIYSRNCSVRVTKALIARNFENLLSWCDQN